MTTTTAAATRTPHAPGRRAAERRDWPAIPVDGSDLTGLRFSIVPHTHWDREWYLPFEQMRLRMARMIDELIDRLETDASFSHFTLDGQAVLLEDYAALRPANVPRLRRLIADGRIAIGPSYVLPDEFLASAEALVRNLLVGRQTCEAFGGRPMAVGYYPDTFGHIAQLPQILAGFGFDAFVFWRGLGDEADHLGAIFEWRAPDGTPVMAIRQLGSYGNANELGRWSETGLSHHDAPDDWPGVAVERFGRFLRRWSGEIGTSLIPELLLCHGSDHMPIQPDLPVLLDAVRAAHPGVEVDITTYEAYVERVRPYLGGLVSHEGEMVLGRDAPVLRGINSARLELKRRYADVERQLVAAETLASLARLRGVLQPPVAELGRAWREVIKNLPHDSISGCSVDEVHRDMRARWDVAEELAQRITRESLAALAGRSEPWTYRERQTRARSVVNVLPWRRTVLATLEVPSDISDAVAEGRHLVATVAGCDVPVQIAAVDGVASARVAIPVDGFDAATVVFGTTAADDRATDASAAHDAVRVRVVNDRTMESDSVRVTVDDDGSLTTENRRTGHIARGIAALDDVGDRGDEYNFDAVVGDEPVAGELVDVSVVAGGPVVAELSVRRLLTIPDRLANDRTRRSDSLVAIPLTVGVRLIAGVDRVELDVAWDNRARDHRLRLRFPAVDAGSSARAEGHFAVIERPAEPVVPVTDWLEPPARTSHTSGAVAAGSIAVVGRGLPEYEAVPRPDGGVDIAITILRSVGWLSRGDMVSRPGHAGPDIATPGAQGLGRASAQIAVRVGDPLDDAALVRWSQDARADAVVGTPGVDLRGALDIEGDAFAFSALKPAEDGDGAILRVWNATREPARLAVSGEFERATGVRLDEMPSEMRPHADGPAVGAEIVSIRLDAAPRTLDVSDPLVLSKRAGFVVATSGLAVDAGARGIRWVSEGSRQRRTDTAEVASIQVLPVAEAIACARIGRPVLAEIAEIPVATDAASFAAVWNELLELREEGLPIRGIVVPAAVLVRDSVATPLGHLVERLAKAAGVGYLRPVDAARLGALTQPVVAYAPT